MPPSPSSRSRPRRSSHPAERASRLEIAIFAGGLVLAVISGIVTYHVVGPYGDGPLSVGYRRITDPETGKSILIHESKDAQGRTIRRYIDDRTLKAVSLVVMVDGKPEEARFVLDARKQVSRVDRDRDGDGRTDVAEYYDADKKMTKAGFSLAGDGVIDAWAYRDGQGRIQKIDVATRRDDVVDRWEYYENAQLARVEEDEDRDGRPDRVSTYDAGILLETHDVK